MSRPSLKEVSLGQVAELAQRANNGEFTSMMMQRIIDQPTALLELLAFPVEVKLVNNPVQDFMADFQKAGLQPGFCPEYLAGEFTFDGHEGWSSLRALCWSEEQMGSDFFSIQRTFQNRKLRLASVREALFFWQRYHTSIPEDCFVVALGTPAKDEDKVFMFGFRHGTQYDFPSMGVKILQIKEDCGIVSLRFVHNKTVILGAAIPPTD